MRRARRVSAAGGGRALPGDLPRAVADAHVLSWHAGYACRSSGACCRAGWAIPLEPEVEAILADAAHRGRFQPPGGRLEPALRAADGLAGGAGHVLAQRADGDCVFFEPERGRLCSIHRQLGPRALPAACRHFPRVCLLTPRGASITLSHFCPTAAGLLFDATGPPEVRRNPPGFPAGAGYEGLDAREGFPLLRPGVRLDWDSHARWEAHAVRTLAREDLLPEVALARLGSDAERVRAWRVADGPLADHLAAVLAATDAGAESGAALPGPADASVHGLLPARPAGPFADALESRALVAGAVPAGLRAPEPAPAAALAEADARFVAPGWTELAAPVRRYLAARAFGSWCGVEGEGLRSGVAFLAAAWGVLRAAAAGRCAAAGRRLDPELLREAVRDSDLLLLHLAEHRSLARRLSAVERRAAVYTRPG